MKLLLTICVAGLFAIAPVTAMAQGKPSDKPAKTLRADGTVSAVSADSLTIKASSGELTFTVDSKTRVSGRGFGTKSAALKKEGKPLTITEFVRAEDRVSVTYHEMGDTKHAAAVRILNVKPVK